MEFNLLDILIMKSKTLLIIFFAIIGAVIALMKKKKQSIKHYIITIITSAFIGWVVGTFASNWLNVPDEVIYAVVGVVGHFADVVYEQIKLILGSISGNFQKFVDKWL